MADLSYIPFPLSRLCSLVGMEAPCRKEEVNTADRRLANTPPRHPRFADIANMADSIRFMRRESPNSERGRSGVCDVCFRPSSSTRRPNYA